MIVEEIRGDADNFPVGMRVLAVDDDPTCLKILESLLRKCQYNVTSTNQARIALKMIRENKDRFDLVISDVMMPDMDGFKLLELVGLELDLPVILLSTNSDPKLVMKGVTHGACDYLVKPIRIEELRNIWQHVIWRKKRDPKSQDRSSGQVKAHEESGDGYGSPLAGDPDQIGKFNRKRKDDEDENEDSGNEYEESGTLKRPRVIWSIELHRKFVTAVNQLGIEKAVPKRILDMMNVDGLTRENVASHLQKYRLYLKRISTAASQQANMAAALGEDSGFMYMGSLDGFGDFRTFSGARLPNVALAPYTNGGMLGRLNTPGNMNLRNLTPSTLVQPSQAQNLSNSINSLGRMHLVLPNSNQSPSLFQGIQSSLELDQLQQNKGTANFNNINNSSVFRTGSTFTDSGAVLGSSNPLMLHGNAQPALNGGGFGNQFALWWRTMCCFSVTTTNQAMIALNMIRENKDRFDLVICDVHMPDVDGFKLLELIGLEMDLPVIMLSANSDPELVMKGVSHGACDYLVKPVRLEELRNIWQHVIRRKKFDSKNQNRHSDKVKTHQARGEGNVSPPLAGNSNQNGKSNRKRKDDEDEHDDTGNNHEDPGTLKKPRFVWTSEVHKEFVAAVHQLGIQKAVPKRILDTMNVKGLTRENVASHLQKFRLYLKRISNQQAHLGAAAGVQGSGFGDFRTLAGARLTNVALSPYTNGGILGRLNTPGNVNLGNLIPTPSTLIQPGQAQNLSNSINSLGRMHLVLPNSNQNPSLFQGIQSSLELDQLQQGEGAANFNSINNSRVFRNCGTVTGTGAALGNSNPPMLHGNPQPPLNGGGFGNQSAHGVVSFTSESFNASLLDPGKCNENWHNSVEVSRMHPNALFSAEPFPSQLLPPNGSRDNIPSNGPYVALPPFEDSRDMQCHQLGSWGDAHNMNQIPANGSFPNSDQNSGILNQMMNMNTSGSASAHMQQDEGGKMATERVSNGDFLYEQPQSHDRFAPRGYDSMNELVHAIATSNQGDGI